MGCSDGLGLLAALLVFQACASGPRILPGRAVVLRPALVTALERPCSRPGVPKVDAEWVPSAAVLDAMEARFGRLTGIKAKRCCMIGARVGDINGYRRQYAGIVIESRKLIYINADATDATGPPPDDSVLDVCDGGGNWGVLYDPASGEFFDLAFNGIG